LEEIMPVQQRARLAVTVDETGPSESEICRRLAGGTIEIRDIGLAMDGRFRTYTINVRASRLSRDCNPAAHRRVEPETRCGFAHVAVF
jgi:hypothetical protein